MNKLIANGYSSQLYANYAADLKLANHQVSDLRLQEFVVDIEQCGLMLTQFNWDDWYQNSHLIERPEYIADASLYECRLLLTAMARIDRFSPGILSNMRRKGVLIAIVERLQALHYRKVG
ncbi:MULTISPECIES: DUF6508 domain-containing protein [Shewanella]|uniref:DUF6508 domain-containing protein n=1 Tax=Shewanella TaxID=22 RepID=UPI0004917DEB|nr:MULTISPECIES: DUF6508 domain-containing protein [Shewanella]